VNGIKEHQYFADGKLSYNKSIGRIAIVRTGVIGPSWAAEYQALGFKAVATDPAPNAESP
jgi:hypothetical protein